MKILTLVCSIVTLSSFTLGARVKWASPIDDTKAPAGAIYSIPSPNEKAPGAETYFVGGKKGALEELKGKTRIVETVVSMGKTALKNPDAYRSKDLKTLYEVLYQRFMPTGLSVAWDKTQLPEKKPFLQLLAEAKDVLRKLADQVRRLETLEKHQEKDRRAKGKAGILKKTHTKGGRQ